MINIRNTMHCVFVIQISIGFDAIACVGQEAKSALLVKQLANANSPPLLVKGKVGVSKKILRPIFGLNNDPGNHNRVIEAFIKLREDGSEECFQELIKHFDDDRYSLTYGFNNGSAQNRTVGFVCEHIAYDRLNVFDTKVDDEPHGRSMYPHISNFKLWLAEHEGKSLLELQQVLGADLLKRVDVDKVLSDEEKAIVKSKVQETLDLISRTGKPKFLPRGGEAYDFYIKN